MRAPELDGRGGWIGAEAPLAALRGRIVLLDFWTLACINCQRVVEELREIERRYADVLTVVGVHSPKFAHERDHEAVVAAVARHRVMHPVIDDPELRTWDAYAVRAWPTLVLIDPSGREVARWMGEGHAAEIATEIERLLADATVTSAAPPPPSAAVPGADLSFPSKVRARGGLLAVSDTGHDRVLITSLTGEVLHEFGGLYQPHGVCWDGDDAVLVCETGAGRVWRIGFDDGGRDLVAEGLASPWDVVRWHGHVTIAEAGRHRIRMVDADGEAQVVAGTGQENLVDGPALAALLAQPSGLAVTVHDELAFLDSEASALRVLSAPGGTVRTLVGTGLFSWGQEDGDHETARLQHPLGLAAGRVGELYIADTFNGLVRVHRGAHLWTVPTEGFVEPGGLDVLPDGRLVVADTGNHRIVIVDAESGVAEALAAPPDPLLLAAGSALELTLDADLEGDALDGDEPVEVLVSGSVPGLVAGPPAQRHRRLPVDVTIPLGEGAGRITVELRVATCTDTVCRLRRTQQTYDVILS